MSNYWNTESKEVVRDQAQRKDLGKFDNVIKN